MDEQMIEDLMREFYLSASYDPKAARPADNVKAAIAFALAHSVIAGKVAELEGRIEAVRKVVEEGYPGQPAKTEQCEHGRYGWEDCVACYDAAILAALAPYPERRSE